MNESPDAPTRQGVDWLVGRWWFWVTVFVVLVGLPLAKTLRRAGALPPAGAAVANFTVDDENGHAWPMSELAGRPFIACDVDDDQGMWRRLAELSARLVHVPADHYHLLAVTRAADTNARAKIVGEFRLAALNRAAPDLLPARLAVSHDADADALFAHQSGCLLVDSAGHRRGTYEVSRPQAMTQLVANFALLVAPSP